MIRYDHLLRVGPPRWGRIHSHVDAVHVRAVVEEEPAHAHRHSVHKRSAPRTTPHRFNPGPFRSGSPDLACEPVSTKNMEHLEPSSAPPPKHSHSPSPPPPPHTGRNSCRPPPFLLPDDLEVSVLRGEDEGRLPHHQERHVDQPRVDLDQPPHLTTADTHESFRTYAFFFENNVMPSGPVVATSRPSPLGRSCEPIAH
jgi:hypothetical protein